MKQQSNHAVVLGAAGILLVTLSLFVFRESSTPADQTRRETFQYSVLKGERLKAAALAKGERIVIDHIRMWDVGEPEGCTYVLIGGSDKTFVSIERRIEWKKGWGPILADLGQSRAYQLSARQQQGLEIYLHYLRSNTGFWWNHPDTYELTYFRDDREIGSEKLIDLFRLDISEHREAYEDVGSDFRKWFSRDEWDVVVTPDGLLRDLESPANQPTEPRSPSLGGSS